MKQKKTRAGKLPAKPTTPTPDAARNHRVRLIANEWRFLKIAGALGVEGDNAKILEAVALLHRGMELLDGLPDTCKIGGVSAADVAFGLRGSEGLDRLDTEAGKWLLVALASTKATGGVE